MKNLFLGFLAGTLFICQLIIVVQKPVKYYYVQSSRGLFWKKVEYCEIKKNVMVIKMKKILTSDEIVTLYLPSKNPDFINCLKAEKPFEKNTTVLSLY